MATRVEPVSGLRGHFAVAGGVLALAMVGLWLYQPYVSYRELHADISTLESDINDLEASNARLGESTAELETPRGIELELRQQGWVRANERVVRTFPSWGGSSGPQEQPELELDVAAQVTDSVASALQWALGREPDAK